MARRKTNEEYIRECKQKEYDLPIEKYQGAHTKIKHNCVACGNTYKQDPHTHLKGHGCPICGGTYRKTIQEYINECKQKGYDLPIEPYVNAKTKIKHRCQKCEKIYEQKPNSHLRGCGCPNCFGNSKKTTKQYIKECKTKGYDLPIEPYINTMTLIKHKCNQCGTIYEQTPNSHLYGRGCPICGGTYRKTIQEYINECKQKGYDLPIEPYINVDTKIKHKCNKCNIIYEQTPHNHLNGHGCPICSQSRGERFIQSYLDKRDIKYIPQKAFNDLKDKQLLSYDFYLSNRKVLIEYQGIQHFESISFDGKVSSNLEKQQYHDKLKREYAKNNGYILLEPTYKLNTQEKINNYLDKHL